MSGSSNGAASSPPLLRTTHSSNEAAVDSTKASPSPMPRLVNPSAKSTAVEDGAVDVTTHADPRCHANVGVSSSQSSGGGSGFESHSRATSTGSSSSAPVAEPTSADKRGDPPPRRSKTATPMTTPPNGRSPALGPASGIRVVPERGTRGSRRHKSSAAASGAGGRQGRTHSGAGSGTSGGGGGGGGRAGPAYDGARYPRTAFDRCKAARTIAAQWMSRLMRSPPEASRIESLRASRTAAASSGLAAHGKATPPLTPISAKAGEPNTSGRGATGTTPNSTFLDAVLKTKSTQAATAAPPATLAEVAVHANLSTAPSPAAEHSPQPTSPNALGHAASSSGGGTHYDSVELVPDDVSHVPSLLHALREIALSCASLDTLGKASTPQGTALEEVTGAARRKGKHGASPPPLASAPPASQAQPSPTCGPADVEGVLVTRSKELHGEYEAQWASVCAHFDTVRRLILNDSEFVDALDTALGEDWRADGVSTTTSGPTDEEEMPSTTDAATPGRVAPPSTSAPRKSSADAHRAVTASTLLDSASVAASSPLSRTAKEYVPREFHPSPSSSVGGGAATNLAAGSTLNSNAEPFHTRFGSPGSFSHASDGGGGGGGGGAGTPEYSPSQAVTSFLERVSPPPPRTGPAAVFPSTPPARETALRSTTEEALVSHSQDDSGRTSPAFSPSSAATTGGIGGTGRSYHSHHPSTTTMTPSNTMGAKGGTGAGGGSLKAANSSTTSSPAFRLESREDMLRRRNAAPSTFYASTTHYYGGASGSPVSVNGNESNPHPAMGNNPGNAVNSAATTPASLYASPPGAHKLGGTMGYMSPTSLAHGPRSMPVSPIMSYNTPVIQPQCPFDYILVIDFEATCEEHPPPGYLYEIIEFPVVLVDVHLQRPVAEFHRFVRPRFKRQLSDFCKALTGIEQRDVDEAATLDEVIVQFERWYHHTLPPNSRTVFATDGPMDFKEFMHNHSVLRQNIRFPSLFYQWIDVKQVFANYFHCQQGKIKVMLEVLHCPFEGRLHSGIDDARNIARIVIGLLQWGCTFCDVPLSRIPVSAPSTATAVASTHNHSSGSHPSNGFANASLNAGAAACMGSSPSSVASMSSSLPFGAPLYLPPSTAANGGRPCA